MNGICITISKLPTGEQVILSHLLTPQFQKVTTLYLKSYNAVPTRVQTIVEFCLHNQ